MSVVFTPRLSQKAYLERLQRIDNEPSDAISKLVAVAGLDPGRDLRFGDLDDCRFDDDDIRGYDLTGCSLARSTFRNALIAGAVFDLAAYAGVDDRAAAARVALRIFHAQPDAGGQHGGVGNRQFFGH